MALRFTDVRSPLLSRRTIRRTLRSAVLGAAGLTRPLRDAAFVRCLYLHYVYDDQARAFRRVLERLRGIGRFITTDELLELISGRRPLDGRFFHLSIDDGFDNVHRNAFPALRELGVPAITFLPSRLVGSDDETLRRHWWMRHVRAATRLMTWDQVREMADAGYEFGSHTATHARLSHISSDPGRLQEEVSGSKREIERRVGRPCRFFAWPFGTARDVDDAGRAAIVEAGFAACFSAIRGRVEPRRTSLMSIPRHHFEPEDPWWTVRYFAIGGGEGG